MIKGLIAILLLFVNAYVIATICMAASSEKGECPFYEQINKEKNNDN